MLFTYILIALLISWTWVDYYRMIDIYEPEDLKHVIGVFLLGGLSVFLVFGIGDFFLDPLHLGTNGSFFNDFFYCVFGIGAVEELAKLLPFLLYYKFFKREVNEPIDFLLYGSASALGFAAFENVMYFNTHGASIIDIRAILSPMTHMFNTAIITYGIARYRFLYKRRNYLAIAGYFLLAALSHGFYDFWILFEPVQPTGMIVTFAYFLITISIFAGILNNALSNSPFFEFEKVILSGNITQRLFAYYMLIFFTQIILLIIDNDLVFALKNFYGQLFLAGSITFITIMRMGRFTLVPEEWQPIPIEFPFTWSGSPFIKVKGNPYDDILSENYFKKPLIISPLSAKRSRLLKHSRKAIAPRKLWFEDGEPAYLLRFQEDRGESTTYYLIKAKAKGATTKGGDPIVHLMKINHPPDSTSHRIEKKDFPFIEWAVLEIDPEVSH
ncbi:PrsW family intramembrane metalloprotease [Cryomorphaceae bacterium 1068]|nr:PrsW family intramembrane metalloprotease [Cryomorphaceae bacterium 1068]